MSIKLIKNSKKEDEIYFNHPEIPWETNIKYSCNIEIQYM